jgi:hypothetical protein
MSSERSNNRNIQSMKRRDFLQISSAIMAAALNPYAFAKGPEQIDAAWYNRSRRFADLPMSRVAYVEHGKGPAALFVHAYFLNSYMVWGLKDALFGVEWAEWLDKTLPGSRCIRRLEQADLLFPEEMPDVIAEEAKGLWGVG